MSARKTHCKNGHEIVGDNLWVSPTTGWRRCKICKAAARKRDYANNRNAHKQRNRRYLQACLKDNPNFYGDRAREQKYDLTVEGYNRKLEIQKNCCAICNRLMDRPCVDHDHETETVRDLLCKNCNCALGLLQDDALIAEKAAEYLRKWKS